MSLFKEKILLITGGTGSFGNAVLRRFLDSDIREIRIFSRDEKKQDDMRHHLQNPKVKFYIGDVRDKRSVDGIMNGVDYIFHAAALKQVAIAKGRQLGNCGGTTICCTRYGNVMASRGSVIPLWVEQIKKCNPITITDPNMTRFMMTLDDAVDLVLYAFQHGKNGDLFVQKAPAATLDVLADALKSLYHSNADVKVIGTRHGEKLYETLVTREEMSKAEDMGDYYRIPCDTRDLNYDKFFVEGSEEVSKIEDYHSHNTRRLDVEGMKELLLKLNFIREDLGLEK